MTKNKTLGDYISSGKHEFVAFVKDSLSAQSSNHGTIGNNLGKILLGVLVCERNNTKNGERARFFYKSQPIYNGDSDIAFADFGYSAQVISEVPLSLSTSFNQHWHLKNGSKEFHEAKKLLKRYSLY